MANEKEFVIENEVLTKYVGEGGDVVIPDGVTKIGANAFANCAQLKSVVIPDGVTEIGNSAFFECRALETVSLPNSIKAVGSMAFMYYDDLKCEIYEDACYLGNEENPFLVMICTENTDLESFEVHERTKVIAPDAFSECEFLEKVKLPDGLTEIAPGLFESCPELKKVNIPDSVVSIGADAFSFCSSLKSIKIPDSVTFIGRYAFSDCDNLTITARAGSCAEEFASANDIKFSAIK